MRSLPSSRSTVPPAPAWQIRPTPICPRPTRTTCTVATQVTAEPAIQLRCIHSWCCISATRRRVRPRPGHISTVISYVLVTAGSTDEVLGIVGTRWSSDPLGAAPSHHRHLLLRWPARRLLPPLPARRGAATPSPHPIGSRRHCVTGVSLLATEPSITYTLVAVPVASLSSGQTGSFSTGSDCGFAAPGPETYASSLCFLDFVCLTPAVDALSTPSGRSSAGKYEVTARSGGQYFAEAIDNSPYTMEFCLLVVELSQPCR